jgi:CHAT domain-containing protein
VTADSLRRSGNRALDRHGLSAALKAWRASLRLAVTIHDSAGAAAALTNIGSGFYTAGTLDSAAVYLRQAHQLATANSDWRAAATALGTLGSVRKDQGNLRQAGELYRVATRLRERIGDTRGLASDHNNLGLIAAELGDTGQARRRYEAALALNRRYDRPEAAAANLLNRANLESFQGSYSKAAESYHEALTIYTQAENRHDAALTRQNIGRLEIRRGNYRVAYLALQKALHDFEQLGNTAEAVAIRIDLVSVLGAMGRLQEATREARQAEEQAGLLATAAETQAGVALARAELSTRMNQLPQAERNYARAERLFRQAGGHEGEAEALLGRAGLALAEGNPGAAQRFLRSARRRQELNGDARAMARTDLLLGYAAERTGEVAPARQRYEAALETFQRLGDPVGEANALGAMGGLSISEGLPLTAESLYTKALTLVSGRAAVTISWWLHGGRGRALRAKGALGPAAVELETAIQEIERSSAGLRLPQRRAAFLEDKWQPYADLILVDWALGRVAKAFEVSERLRARQMLDLLALSRIAEPGPGSPSAREQDLRQRVNELTRRLQEAESPTTRLRGDGGQAPSLNTVREALFQAQEQYDELLLHLREDRPELARLVSGTIATASEVSGRLGPNAALVEYMVHDSGSIAFVVTSDSVTAVDLDVNRRALARLVDFTRGTLAPGRSGVGQESWRAPLKRLHQQLVAPLEATGLLRNKQRLLIAPHAELHYLPFPALLEAGSSDRFLIERYDLSLIPSASVWIQLHDRPGEPGREKVLALAPQPGRLPGTQAEVASLRDLYGDRATILLGADASEVRFRELAADYDIAHLATFGILNKQNPMFSFVALRDGSGHDGRLEVHEIFGLRLRARLIVLSACQTGLGSGAMQDVPAGDDWVGLVRAFLHAGSSRVLATIWPVEDRTAAKVMQEFYRSLSGGHLASQALGDAQRIALRSGRKNPFYWAGYALIGGT